ncbi:SRPBCC family protein [Bacillus mycoides]|uniref:SRPBCC family protein n=1 Tax=Bacillus mycoides TaxID=1405 RepID=A0A4U2WPF7_BACMY|nr:SRPBCC family protein [Bacillus mycoides]TKI35555.1 SRPBCC family protein [Bacillus mycoides]TKI82249.1 SRPBCC family protein [Bacillus mycoides]
MIITFQMEIQAPIEKAFSYLEDPEKQMKWMQGLEGTEHITTYDPANPVGTKFKQRLRERGQVQEYEGQVIAYEKNSLLGIQLDLPAFLIEVKYQLEILTDKSCRLSLTERIEAKTLISKIMNFLFRGIIKRTIKKQMILLKQSVEESTH